MSMQRMFNVRCDGVDLSKNDCLNVSESSEWYSTEARESARIEGWVRHSGKDYCPSCAERQVWKNLDSRRRR